MEDFYNYLNVPEKTTLPPMTNQVWHDDPKRLLFTLSRYKFAARMLTGCAEVAEVGCGDGFGARLVMQAGCKVDLYDKNVRFINGINGNVFIAPKWRQAQAKEWDILFAPLPRAYDGVYSLDVMEHIPPAEEKKYLGNIHASLRGGGRFIVGMPSLESQAYASPQSRAGHVNCKTGEDLRAVLRRYWPDVLLFSMNDEVVHTGFMPMAHYLFAVCTGRL